MILSQLINKTSSRLRFTIYFYPLSSPPPSDGGRGVGHKLKHAHEGGMQCLKLNDGVEPPFPWPL